MPGFFLSKFFYQVLSFGMIVSSALMIWKGLMVVTGSESPIVVVLRWVTYALNCGAFTHLYQLYPITINYDLMFNLLSSGSMEPAFHRGDLLFLTNPTEEPVRVGEIVVFKIEGRDIPIVHRVLKVHEK